VEGDKNDYDLRAANFKDVCRCRTKNRYSPTDREEHNQLHGDGAGGSVHRCGQATHDSLMMRAVWQKRRRSPVIMGTLMGCRLAASLLR